jgi:hypothetical protein
MNQKGNDRQFGANAVCADSSSTPKTILSMELSFRPEIRG